MIKKIKPIKIIVAVVTALVFCIALAVPCFADSPTDGTDYVINTVTFTDGNSAYQWIVENGASVIKAVGTVNSAPNAPSVSFNSIQPQFFDGSVVGLRGTTFILTDFIDDEGTPTAITESVFFDFDADSLKFSPFLINFVFGNSELPEVTVNTTIDGVSQVFDIPHAQWDIIGLSMTLEYTTEYVPKDNATRSGMFGQLYNILRDAIFGKDVSLDDSQDFVLTQISTWMTYIVILLPILVVGVILFRIFCR